MNPLLMEKMARAHQQDILREAGKAQHASALPAAPRLSLMKVLGKMLEELLAALNAPREEVEPRKVIQQQAGD